MSWAEGNLFLLRHYHFTPRVRVDGALVHQCSGAAAADGVLRAISGPLQVRCRGEEGGGTWWRDNRDHYHWLHRVPSPSPAAELSSGHKWRTESLRAPAPPREPVMPVAVTMAGCLAARWHHCSLYPQQNMNHPYPYSRVQKSSHKLMLTSYMKYFAKFLPLLLHNTSFFHFYFIFHTS